jgi:hypothetical protein
MGVTANRTPLRANQSGLKIELPIARAARSVVLALPATIVSVTPISMYEVWEPKIGNPIITILLISEIYFFTKEHK